MLRCLKWSGVAVACCGVAMPAVALSQVAERQPGRAIPNQPARQEPPSTPDPTENHDAFLAEWLTIDNNHEIALAELAVQRTANNEVKQFAQKLIADHQLFNEQLMPFAHHRAQRVESARRTTSVATAQNPQRRTVAHVAEQGEIPGRPRAHGGGMLSLKREIADQRLASARQELGRKSGREFDDGYMQMQLGMHVHAIDEMAVFERYASPELRQAIADGEQKAERHLQMAKNYVQHEDQSAGRQ